MKKVEKDFEELLKLFNKHRVKYCIVGAFAVAFHAVPRYTKDLDILVKPDELNGIQIVKALEAFGFASLKLSAKDFSKEGLYIQLGYEPLRIDLITSVEGITFQEVWKNKKSGFYGPVKTFFIGLKELIKNKRAVKRKQDLADLEILEKVAKNKNRFKIS